MQDLNDLYYFVKSGENGGFAAAGRALGIPKSKLVVVLPLESRLDTKLIYRSTRSSSSLRLVKYTFNIVKPC